MSKVGILSLLLVMACTHAVPAGAVIYTTKSFLRPQKFPKVFRDLSFAERVAILAEGFGEVDSVYDSNGVCISGCAYEGITIEEEKELIAQATEEFNEAIAQNGGLGDGAVVASPINPDGADDFVGGEVQLGEIEVIADRPEPGDSGNDVVEPLPDPVVVPEPVPEPVPAPVPSPEQNACSAAVPGVLPPLKKSLIVVSDFGWREIDRGTKNHMGIDLRATKGTMLYAPADGTVTNACDCSGSGGCRVRINHGTLNGKTVETLYMHLKEDGCKVRSGYTVKKGELIAETGDTGNVDAHLDYRVFYNSVPIDPLGSKLTPYELDSEGRIVQNSKYKQDHVFLSAPYKIKKGITSRRVSGYTEEQVKSNFPCCEGFSN